MTPSDPLTPPSIDAVRREPAGPRLNSWVAQYVFGWSDCRTDYGQCQGMAITQLTHRDPLFSGPKKLP